MGSLFSTPKAPPPPPAVPLPDIQETEASRKKKQALRMWKSSSVSTVLTDKQNQPLGG
jgi:hypothetical protein